MSKNVSIEEGDRARNFGPTAKIKTELQGGGYCYWVPEDERETGMVFASENREYTPDEIGKYGIDEIDINIIFTGVDPDGNPWDVTIDPDTGLPDIEYPDDNIEMIIDPETGDIIIKPIDDIEPIAKIDDGILGDMGFDPEGGIDMSLDDPGDLGDMDDLGDLGIVGDIDGIPSVVDLDLDNLEWDTADCPASIKVMHVPNKTNYNDGERIDLDGLVVQAFNADGTPWSSSKYPDGYIPAHELRPDADYAAYDKSNDLAGMIDGSFLYNRPNGSIVSGSIFSGATGITNPEWSGATGGGSASVTYGGSIFGYLPWVTMSFGGKTMGPFVLFYSDIAFRVIYNPDGGAIFQQYQINGPGGNSMSISPDEAKEVTKDAYYFKDGESGQILNVGWTSPCFSEYSTHVDLTTNKTEDHGGSHHSGKF